MPAGQSVLLVFVNDAPSVNENVHILWFYNPGLKGMSCFRSIHSFQVLFLLQAGTLFIAINTVIGANLCVPRLLEAKKARGSEGQQISIYYPY
jgi:hypothetical protein